MKRNAIIRIILWSFVIVFLLAVLVFVLGARFITSRENVIIVDPEEEIVNSAEQIAPTPTHTFDANTANSEISNNTTYANSLETGANHNFQIDPTGIREISIDWVSGNIVIEAYDGDTIQIREEGSFDAKYTMVCSLHQNKQKLSIQYCENGLLKNFSFGIGKNLRKDLYIQVPRDWVCEELEIDTASSDVEIYSLTIWDVEIDGASGTCLFDSCDVRNLDLDTASGDVEFQGSLQSLDFDAASASFTGVLTNVPNSINMDSASGDLTLTLPENAGFSAQMDGMSNHFTSDFPTTLQNGRYLSGDGQCRIDVDGMSCDVVIYKSNQPSI